MAYRNDISSPDPLNDSLTFSSPTKPRRTTRARQSLPLSSSPTKQTFQLDVGSQLSPQKLYVTVEAENAHGELSPFISHAGHALGNQLRKERTTTTRIPVKGLSDTEEDTFDLAVQATPKRGRGRPRKGNGTPIRAATPAGKGKGGKRRTLGGLVDGDDEDDWDFQVGKGVEISRGKGRSRSRSMSRKRSVKIPASESASQENSQPSSAVPKDGKSRRKTQAVEEIVVHEDEDSVAVGLQELDIEGTRQSSFLERHNGSKNSNANARSAANDEEDRHSDVLLAHFNNKDTVSGRTGWSSSRNGIMGDMNGARSSGRYPSPDLSPEKFQKSIDHQMYEDEAEDQMGDMPEFDTIMESEGFSMISVDSVPSLREHLSSPLEPVVQQQTAPSQPAVIALRQEAANDSFSSIPAEILEAATPRRPMNRNLLLAKNVPGSSNDSFSSIPQEILDAATPGRKPINRNVTSIRDMVNDDDSFSSIPSQILEAATPGRKAPIEYRDTQSDDSFSDIDPDILEAATPRAPQYWQDQSLFEGNTTTVDATMLLQADSSMSSLRPSHSRLPTPGETPSPTHGNQHSDHHSSISYHQTPTKVTDNDQFDEDSPLSQSYMRSSPPSFNSNNSEHSSRRSSHRGSISNMMETPSIMFSSPSLPPQVQTAARVPPIKPQISREGSTQSLETTVRAGRVLQDIMVPSSPRGRSDSLGSPFKSPSTGRGRSQSMLQIPDGNGLSLVPQLTPGISRKSGSFENDANISGTVAMQSGPRSARSQARSSDTSAGLIQAEDPFAITASVSQAHKSSSNSRNSFATNRSSRTRNLNSTFQRMASPEYENSERPGSLQSRTHTTTMIPLNYHSSSSLSMDSSVISSQQHDTVLRETARDEQWARERAEVSKQINSADKHQVIVLNSDSSSLSTSTSYDDDSLPMAAEQESTPESVTEVERGADIDIWQLEAVNSSANSSILETRNSEKSSLPEPVEKPRRSKLPTDWRQNSKRLVYSDELTKSSSPASNQRDIFMSEPAHLNDEQDEAQKRRRQRFARKVQAVPTRLSEKPAAVESPRVIESSQVSTSANNKSKQNASTSPGFTERLVESKRVSNSSPVSSVSNIVEEKPVFQPRSRTARALAAAKQKPARDTCISESTKTAVESVQADTASEPIEPRQPSQIKSAFEPRRRSTRTSLLAVKSPNSSTLENLSMLQEPTQKLGRMPTSVANTSLLQKIPQKTNFAPRPREGKTEISLLLGSSPPKAPLLFSRASGLFDSNLQVDTPPKSPLAESSVTGNNVVSSPLAAESQAAEEPKPASPERTRLGDSPRILSNIPLSPVASTNFRQAPSSPTRPSLLSHSSASRINGLASPILGQESDLWLTTTEESLFENKENPTPPRDFPAQFPSQEPPATRTLSPPPPAQTTLPSPPSSTTSKKPHNRTTSTTSISSILEEVSFSAPTKPTGPVALSSTIWSRSHWLLLDRIYQVCKPLSAAEVIAHYDSQPTTCLASCAFPFSHATTLYPANKCPHPRPAVVRDFYGFAQSPLTGKRIGTKDEVIVFEQWHVEIVAAFREECYFEFVSPADEEDGWWNEVAVACRLVSLAFGEERRRAGMGRVWNE